MVNSVMVILVAIFVVSINAASWVCTRYYQMEHQIMSVNPDIR